MATWADMERNVAGQHIYHYIPDISYIKILKVSPFLRLTPSGFLSKSEQKLPRGSELGSTFPFPSLSVREMQP